MGSKTPKRLEEVWGSGGKRLQHAVLIPSTQGPEFVRKHIFNKHAEKIEEVKKEVAFFNNFLTDAKRPALPEMKPAQPPGPAQILPPGLTPGLPYPHQTPQGLMPYGQPRPPILGYGGECGKAAQGFVFVGAYKA